MKIGFVGCGAIGSCYASYLSRKHEVCVLDTYAPVIESIKKAGSLDGEKIMKALETCDLEGVTGHIVIGPQHDPVNKTAWLIKMEGPVMRLEEQFSAKD